MNNLKQFFKDRSKNPQFYIRVILISFLPILSYMGMSEADLTSWLSLWEALKQFVSNPYLLGLYVVTLYQSFKNTGVK